MRYLLFMLLAISPLITFQAHAGSDNPIATDPITVYYIDDESLKI